MLCKVKVIPLVLSPADNLKKLRQEWEEASPDLMRAKGTDWFASV